MSGKCEDCKNANACKKYIGIKFGFCNTDFVPKSPNEEECKALDDVIELGYEEAEREHRKEFFSVLGIEDDGRLSANMTEEEWLKFSSGKPRSKSNYAKDVVGKHFVRVYFTFEPYHDVTYSYCVDDGCIYEDRMYIGE